MESANEEIENNSQVKELQASLFPPIQKSSGSYFANFFIKSSISDDEDDEKYKIKEIHSKDLFNREQGFNVQLARWPTECQVLQERIKHIQYLPPVPEPYYVQTGKEVQPKPTGEECGIMVYQYIPISAVNYFSRSSIGGSKYLLNTILCPEEDTLRFESRFESGNLARAIRITPNYYELYLRSDLYTNKHMQWFYFRITNMKKNFLYRLSIVNFSKEDSLYNEGMKPLMYSTKDSQLHSIGWRRCGDNITYYSNDNISLEEPDQLMTYTLSFTIEFPHDDDEVYLAHCYPYTYSDLEDYLMELSNHPVKSTFTTIRLLCKSLAGNNVHYITITSPPVPNENNRKKKAVVITARVHPGETPSSWMMKGFLDFLTSDSSPAKQLRDKFIFKLVPMLNPDGVIVGNNRCSLSAKDLNRQYRTVMRDAYPSIWYTKLMVRRLLEECGVAMYCDLHAHSRKHNIFIYGCENRRGGNERLKLQEQVFPLMLHKNTADKFSFESCQFRIQKVKEGTGRVVMWMMGIGNSFTMEASFAGSTLGTRAESHFSTQDYEQMGRSFCQTLLDFYDDDPRKEKLRLKIINRLVKEGSNADEPTNIRLSDYSSDEGDTSTSSNEVGREEDEEEIVLPIVPPCSPIIIKKTKPKVIQTKKVLSKSPNPTRKPLPICKATLGLSLSEKDCYTSSYNSSDSEVDTRKNLKLRRNKKRRKKKRNTQKIQYFDYEFNVETTKFVSVYDIIPTEQIAMKHSKQNKQPKPLMDRRMIITQQLQEVQARLEALKHKIWLGVGGNGDAPLWTNFSPKKERKKKQTNKQAKNQKKNKTDFKRQTAIDLTTNTNKCVCKSNSLPIALLSKQTEDKENKKLVSKKRGKFAKNKSKNVKVVLRKD